MAKKALNLTLSRSRLNKNDNFYTQLSDIEKELKHYQGQFQNQTIYCNCDDPRVSNFVRYFLCNFKSLRLKKLITTCHQSQSVDRFSQHETERAIYLEYDGDKNESNLPSAEEVGIKHLQGDGDFRSAESIALLKQADIVVTNPPFSLFREYVAQLMEHQKKFLIIGDLNAITYKDIFKLIKDHKLWLGYDSSGTKWFQVPADYDVASEANTKFINGIKYCSKGNATWYTNLDTTKRYQDLILYKRYSSIDYLKYDNYDAINVNRVAEIPMDYDGVMGVPITFIDKHNPDQFEIIGLIAGNIKGLAGIPSSSGKDGPYINGKLKYGRVLIRNKKPAGW